MELQKAYRIKEQMRRRQRFKQKSDDSLVKRNGQRIRRATYYSKTKQVEVVIRMISKNILRHKILFYRR